MKIFSRAAFVLFAISLILGLSAPTAPAAEKEGIQLGKLTCKTRPETRTKLFLRSSVVINCSFETKQGTEKYKGEIGFLGVDLSKKSEEVLYFTVVGLTSDYRVGSHSLAGGYVGAQLAAGIVKHGIGTSGFVGGLKKNFSLVPSIDVFKGAGITLGVSKMQLAADK